jgi:hypothetical protein
MAHRAAAADLSSAHRGEIAWMLASALDALVE